jgi:hypothetical protein
MKLTVGQNRRDVLEPNIGAGDGCIIVTSKGHPIDDWGNYVLVDEPLLVTQSVRCHNLPRNLLQLLMCRKSRFLL